MTANSWSVPVTVAEIPETGRRFDLSADAKVRAELARVAGVQGLSRLAAEFELARHGRDGVHVVGHITATVEQNCVLTLEPLQNEVNEDVNLVFVPQNEAAEGGNGAGEGIPSEEPPEALRDGVVDLGAIATEFLLLGIDPYPRKPGSIFNAPKPKENEADRPFAVLAALKKNKAEREG